GPAGRRPAEQLLRRDAGGAHGVSVHAGHRGVAPPVEPVREDPCRRHGDRRARALRESSERALHLALWRAAPRAAATRVTRDPVSVPVARAREDPAPRADRAWGPQRVTPARRR